MRIVIHVDDLYLVPVSDKLPKDVQQRHLADEGLYVGKPFHVDLRNRNVMEHRLVKNKVC